MAAEGERDISVGDAEYEATESGYEEDTHKGRNFGGFIETAIHFQPQTCTSTSTSSCTAPAGNEDKFECRWRPEVWMGGGEARGGRGGGK